MKNKLLTILIVALVLLNVSNFIYGYSNAQQTNDLKTDISALPKQPVVYNGQNGYTPKKGIDYTDGSNGHDGINAISFNTTVVKDAPLLGAPGTAGKDAPMQEIRLNNTTGNVETKMSDQAFWTILIPCEKLVVSCTNNIGTTPNQSPGDFESF